VVKKITGDDVLIPLETPESMHKEYIQNYLNLTRNTGNLMLFAGDQKITEKIFQKMMQIRNTCLKLLKIQK